MLKKMYDQGKAQRWTTLPGDTLDGVDLRSLRGWLNEAVIFSCMRIFLAEFRHAIDVDRPPPFLLSSIWHTYMMQWRHDPAKVRAWTDKFIDACHLDGDIIIPIHRPGHWILGIVCMMERRIIIADSMRGTHAEVVESLKSWLKDELE